MIGTWRQNQARQSYWDEAGATGKFSREGLEAVIEIATTVKITNDLIEAFEKASGQFAGRATYAGLKAIFKAAGFEVVE